MECCGKMTLGDTWGAASCAMQWVAACMSVHLQGQTTFVLIVSLYSSLFILLHVSRLWYLDHFC